MLLGDVVGSSVVVAGTEGAPPKKEELFRGGHYGIKCLDMAGSRDCTWRLVAGIGVVWLWR